MEDDFESINKGIFVLPYDEGLGSPEPGPSRPLKAVYDRTYERYVRAQQEYEADTTAEQLDDIGDWLDRCAEPPLLKPAFEIHRLPVAVIQNISSSLPPLLGTLLRQHHTLHGRELSDLSGAVRAVAVGFMGEQALATRKSGRTGIEELERWREGRKDRPPLLLHIQDAQAVPTSVLSELLYILTLHPALQMRVLLSASSVSTLLATWSHIEASAIDLSILQAGRRRKAGGVTTLLKAVEGDGPKSLRLSEDLTQEIQRDDHVTGGGFASALKAINFAMLRHSLASPLAALAEMDDPDQLLRLQQLVDGWQRGEDVPGRELLEVDVDDLGSVLDPAPRHSILWSLAHTSSFIPNEKTIPSATTSTAKSRKSKRQADAHTDVDAGPENLMTEAQRGGDLKELETLYALWSSAGKSVNLWDWLEGFRVSMTEDEVDQLQGAGSQGGEATHVNGQKRKRSDGEDDGTAEEDEEEREARLHAAFVRFCEESRMLGLVRAKGKGVRRRGDEVVKGIGLV